jgi:phospholipid/cholesterol/gamma-HCH transport system substrate-binding protein
MKSTKNTRALAVGIFIFLALVIFIVGVLTLGGQRKTFANTIDLRAVFNDVNGLQSGSNVWYAGVKVGTVKSMRFTPEGRVEVLLGIEEEAKEYIHQGVRARVGADGLIGNKIIVLTGGDAALPLIAGGQTIAAESVVNMDELMNTLQANNKNLLAITTDFKNVSRQLAGGEGTIGRLLNDNTIALDLERTLATLQRAMQHTETLTTNLSAYTGQLQRKGSFTNDLISDTVIFSRLRATVSQIEGLSQSASEVVNNLKTTTSSVNASLASTSTPAGALLNDTATAEGLKAVIRNLQTSTQKLDENMEALQHNFLFRGYFRKKKKNM